MRSLLSPRDCPTVCVIGAGRPRRPGLERELTLDAEDRAPLEPGSQGGNDAADVAPADHTVARQRENVTGQHVDPPQATQRSVQPGLSAG